MMGGNGNAEEEGEEDEDYETEKPPEDVEEKVSLEQKMVADVLGMARHFLPSSSPALQCLVLRIVAGGVEVLASAPRTLLPLIAQCWTVLLPRLSMRASSSSSSSTASLSLEPSPNNPSYSAFRLLGVCVYVCVCVCVCACVQ
jgi:hypothetical protein